ncbi:hypothetical protein NIES4073_02960 (plasmid) [Kalymmatonema gypsitolerans NIES-4073]|jgi:hypothetical protein|nr:hypothetical protein [Scytonema hyalinum WJT4-NPBG1]BAZ19426.1 hypothetical protein NIES4073_02960 [Scytonema sp. NIES-4073]
MEAKGKLDLTIPLACASAFLLLQLWQMRDQVQAAHTDSNLCQSKLEQTYITIDKLRGFNR